MEDAILYTVDKYLVDWLDERNSSDFPKTTRGGDSFPNRYKQACIKLDSIHAEVNTRALMLSAIDLVEKNQFDLDRLIYLNNHGKGHVDSVIQMATEILKATSCALTSYEGYLLLMAIQFHDVGIIFGRKEHNLTCRKIMKELGDRIGLDQPEKKMIIKISACHGGEIFGSKDTITNLQPEDSFMGQTIRPSLLAAVLRLSDELADDLSRSSKEVTELDDFPECSKLFHQYSLSLQPPQIKKDKVILRYDIDKSELNKKYLKYAKDKDGNLKEVRVYLIDEIYQRTWKMYNELIYCNRFFRPYMDINQVEVTIDVSSFDENSFEDENEKIDYVLQESGYPGFKSLDIFSFCPALKEKTGGRLCAKFHNSALES